MCRSPHKTSTCSMPAPWRSAFAPFRGSPHEPRATPLAPTSSGFGLPACDRFPDRSAQSRHDAALPWDSSQLPELPRRRTPRGESPEPIAPRTSYPSLDVPPALASAAADHHLLHPPAPRSAFDLSRAGVDETTFSTRSSDPSGGLSARPAETSTSALSRAGSTPAAGVPPAQRSGQQRFSADPPHRHAHRRVRRFVLRLPPLDRSRSMGDSRAARQTQDGTYGAGGFLCGGAHPTLTILSLPRSAASRWPAPGPSELQGSPRSSTPRSPASGLTFLGPL